MTTKLPDESCECHTWCTDRHDIMQLTGHHINCPTCPPNRDKAWKGLISKLINGIRSWAADEDGVHPDCWEAFRESVFICEGKVLSDEPK
jgi:hypothetical protein